VKKIILVEDNEELKVPLIFSIESTQKYHVINTFSSGEDVLKQIGASVPDIVIMDIELQGKMNGIECTAALKKIYPSLDVLMLTVFDDSDQVFEALRAGACGYMTKTTSNTEIIAALDEASAGGAPMSFKIARLVLNSFNKNQDSPLTKKEDEILNLLAKGASYKTAANLLSIATETVKYHIKNIYVKLQVNTKEDAIELARKKRWI
jgi:DNA-binding NarL/FixJ family response regulator